MVLSWLMRRLGAARLRRPDLHFVVYSRAGCHLCDAAWDLLRDVQRHAGFNLEKIDIDADPQLAEKYGTCVPVVAVNGKVRFRGQINPALLERVLQSPKSSPPR